LLNDTVIPRRLSLEYLDKLTSAWDCFGRNSVIRRGPFKLLCGADSIKFSIQNAEWRGIHIILYIILYLYFSVHYVLLLTVEKIIKMHFATYDWV